MIQTKNTRYKKAYTELNEIIKELSKAELEKIPKELIKNIKTNMDKEYKWEYDKSKRLLDQNLMPETKALIVEIYEKYLCPGNEKEFWKEYDRICLSSIEKQKRSTYNTDKIFKERREHNDVNQEISECKKDNLVQKILKIIKRVFKMK